MTNNCWELKRSYQRHLGWGVVFSGTGSILLVLFLLWVSSIFSKPETGRIVMIKALAELGSPVMIIPEDTQGQASAEEGKPVPTSKPEVVKFGTPYRGEIHPGVFYDPTIGGAGSKDGKCWVEIVSPKNDVKVLGLPRCWHIVVPDYPDSTVEATVWVWVLIDPKGKIREVFVKESAPGFGDAVLKAVEQWGYHPGKSDKAVRTGFKVEFRLKT